MSIIVVDAAMGFGNGLCLPAGPLREPVAAGLQRATLVLSVGDAAAQQQFTAAWGAMITVPHVAADVRPLATGMDWAGARVLAFAGIGRPEKFFATLRGLGAVVVRGEALDDHQPLSEALLRRLATEAAAAGAQLVTTEKDAARLPESFRMDVLTLPVRLEVDDWSVIDAALARIL
jgi:tetraacyldisaccharide 4'-kinase